MTLFYHEVKKLWSQKSVLLGVVVFVFLSSGIWYFNQSLNQSETYQYKEHLALKKQYDNLSISKAVSESSATLERLSLYQEYQQYIVSPLGMVEEKEVFHDPEFIAMYEAYTFDNDLNKDLQYTKLLNEFYSGIHDFEDYVDEVMVNIERLKISPVWNTYSEGRKAYYDDFGARYAQLQSVRLESTNYITMESALNANVGYLLLAAGIFITLSLYNVDEARNMNALLLLTRKGRVQTIVMRVVVMVLSIFFMSFVIHASILMVAQLFYGKISWGAAVQSIPSLYTAPYLYSLGQWYLWMCVLQTFAVIALSSLFAVLYHLFKNKKVSIILFVFVVLVGKVLYHTIDDTMLMVPLKYLNLVSLVNAQHLLSQYKVIEIFGLTLQQLKTVGLLNLITIIVSIGIVLNRSISLKRNNLKLPQIPSKIHQRFIGSLNLYRFEAFKLFLMQKGWIVVLTLFIAHGYYLSQTVGAYSTLSYEREIASMYAEYGGVLNTEKEARIEAESLRISEFETEYKEMYQSYQDEAITEEAFLKYFGEYLAEKQYANIYKHFYGYYEARQGNVLTYPNGYQTYFSMISETRDFRNALFMIVGMVFVITPIFSQDKEKNMDTLFVVTKEGNHKRIRNKILIACLFAVGYVLLLTLSEYLAFSYIYPMKNWNATILDVHPAPMEIWGQWYANLSLWQYFGIMIGMRVMGAGVVCTILIYISNHIKSVTLSYLVGLSVLLLPIALQYLGNNLFEYVALNTWFMGNRFIFDASSKYTVMIYICVVLILLITSIRQRKLNK